MSRSLALMTLMRRARSPVHVTLLALLVALPVVFAVASRSAAIAGSGLTWLLVLVLGAGLVGEDVASGALVLTLTRPLRRCDVVITLAATVAAAAFALALLRDALVLAAGLVMRLPDMPGAVEIASAVTEHAAAAAGGAAVAVLYGAVFRGALGLGVWVVMFHLPLFFSEVVFDNHPVAQSAARLVSGLFVTVGLDPGDALGYERIAWSEVTTFALGTWLCVTLATAALNGRELPNAR